ncbi:MAG: KpsF/GutQ family sugar-phosphate isomerase [Gammaproteobacteria bacterium]|nr:KpsF/GutQ family sugar-phosphate isomerase [Gammaproteobacteria bacterium]
MTLNDPSKTLLLAKQVIKTQATALEQLIEQVDDNFTKACSLILETSGRVIIVGIGKSGHIGRKIAATMASTGTPAFFVSAAEASHGDLGMICRGDIVLLLSNSGESDELVSLITPLKKLGLPLIALTGSPRSTLSKNADVHIDISVQEEACPLGLAPTTSTTATLVIGDALAIALLDARGFDKNDFARSHPGGKLGKRLTLCVKDIMRDGEQIPKISANTSLKQGLLEVSSKGLGMTAIVEEDDQLIAVFTDGDLRRALDQGLNINQTMMQDVMTRDYQHTGADILVVEVLELMQTKRISAIPVIDDNGKLIGALSMHDLLNAGVI